MGAKSAEALSEYHEIVSKLFGSEDEGFHFYNKYALEKGFSVRKGYVEWDEANKEIILRKIVCSREGFREEKYMMKQNRKRKARKIDAFAYISNVETDSTSVLTTYQTKKLTEQGGSIPHGWGNRMVSLIAKKCLGRHMLFAPMNVSRCHWILLVLNFMKEEVQVLDSLASNHALRDVAQEVALVSSIQACIDYAVEGGMVKFSVPIDLTQWEKHPYTNIPQQLNNYSCGAFVLKYMLAWDGEKMAEPFTQAQVDIFSWKMCTRLLFSECNKHRLESYKKALTKEEYDARNAKENQRDAPNEDYVEVRSDPKDHKNSKKLGSTKRKRGRPRKIVEPVDPIVQKFTTETIVERVQKKTSRVSKPGPLKKSPYKQI